MWKPKSGKPWGGEKFTISSWFKRITDMYWYISELGSDGRLPKSPSSWRRSICIELPRWMEHVWDMCSCTTSCANLFVTTRLLTWWLRLHARNLVIIHICPPWMHGRYTSATWERGIVSAGGDLGSCYWELPSEVGDAGLWVTPESDAFGTGGLLRDGSR